MTVQDQYRRTLCGIGLAARFVSAMPKTDIEESVIRASAMMNAMRVMSMGSWYPTFPYSP